MRDDEADMPATPELEEMFCFDIYATQHVLAEVYKPLLAPLGVTYPQYLVLIVLWRGEGPLTVGEIGAYLNLESSTLTPLIKRLEGAGMVARRRDPGDNRRVSVTLTEAGWRLRAEAAHIPGCVALATGLGHGELTDLQKRINGVRSALARYARTHEAAPAKV